MLDRTVAPPFAKNTSFHLIKPTEAVLDNGASVYFVPGGSQDVLRIECIMPAGRWHEEMPGASWFTAQLLSRGTKLHDSFHIARLFDQLGAHLDINPGLDFISVAVMTLNRSLSPVLDLFLELLTEPAFPEREYEQVRDVFLQNVSVNNEKTSFVASKEFRRNLFGENHPYGRSVEHQEVSALTTVDFAHHFNTHCHSPLVFVSGRVTPENSEMLIKRIGSLRSGEKANPRSYESAAAAPDIRIEKQGSLQASLRVGGKSIRRRDPDYIRLLFATHILGGYFGSRLMKNIREEKGLTYGIHASLISMQHEGYLVIGADVNKENIELAFDEINKELRSLREIPVPADELETSRNHFIGSLQAEITTPFAHAEKIKTIKLFGLDEDYYQQLIHEIDSLDAEAVMATADRHFREDAFCRVAVG